MTTINTYYAYNQRRYSLPWVCEYDAKTGKYNFDKKVGRYTGKAGEEGELVVTEPVKGQVYAYGQKDYRGNNTEKEYAIWNGLKFVACDNCGRVLNPEDEIAEETTEETTEEPQMKTQEELKSSLDEQVINNTLDLDVYNDFAANFSDPGSEIYYASDISAIRNELADTEEFDAALEYAKNNGDFDEDDTYLYFDTDNRELRVYTTSALSAIPHIDTVYMAERLYDKYETDPAFVGEFFPAIAEFIAQ